MKVSLVAVTQPASIPMSHGICTAEDLMVYAARVSNPDNQLNLETAPKLLAYCLRNGHFSVFETASMTLEVKTSVAIATQILRHRSFTFQQFSARYADPTTLGFELVLARRQDPKNRQNSVDDLPKEVWLGFAEALREIQDTARAYYDAAIKVGVAKECARFLLPQSQTTRLYMTGSCRSWLHYIQSRNADGVQAEHRDVAKAIQEVFVGVFPTVAGILGWGA